MQHRANIRITPVQLGVQQGFRRRLFAVQRLTCHIHLHDIGRLQIAFVPTGYRDCATGIIQALGKIAAGRRTPALLPDTLAGGDQT
jgi:hypothetical protein